MSGLLPHLARCALVALVLALLPGRPVSAQAARGSREYQRVLQEAMAEYERSNWNEARALFEAAHELQPSARTARAIGMCAFEEKLYVKAIANLSLALTEARKPLTADQRKQTEDALWRAREFVGQYQLDLSPSDATLLVDGQPPFIDQGKLLLDVGTHQISLSAEGYASSERSLTVHGREAGTLVLKLALPQSAEPAAAPTPAPASAAPATAAGAAPVDAQPRARLSKVQWAGIGLVAAGAVGLGLGVGFGLDAKKKHDRSGCGDTCETPEAMSQNSKARTSANIATAMFATGGALALGGVLLAVLGRERRPSASAWQVRPVLAQGFVGGSAHKTW